MKIYKYLTGIICILGTTAGADGIVARIVSSPLSATGTVSGAHTGLNVYLQSEEVTGDAFMNPEVPGYGFPPGGLVEIEMGEGFERLSDVPIEQSAIMVVAGAQQQGMPGAAVGYEVTEGNTPMQIHLRPTEEDGIPIDRMMPPAPGAKNDPVRNRGAKVFHIGLTRSAFRNVGDAGTVHVRFFDADGTVVNEGSGSIDFLESPEPQIFPNNFPDANRNHNWQHAAPGETLGKSPGTVPLAFVAYEVPEDVPKTDMVSALDGRHGVGVLSAAQLAAAEFQVPQVYAQYDAGLIVEDVDGNMVLDPATDSIIGGVMIDAPEGAMGQDLRSLDVHGAMDLSKPTTAYNARFGAIFGGAIGLMQFTAGDKPGAYSPRIALLRDPADPSAGESASYAYTVIVE